MSTAPWALVLIFITTILNAFGSVYLKKGALDLGVKPLLKNFKLMSGILLYGVSAVLFIIGLKGGELSVLYPIAALGYVWISILSVKMLGEKMGTLKWIGVAVIMAGVEVINKS